MAEMSPGDKCFAGLTRKLGQLRMAKVMFFIISTIVCLAIFYANTNMIGRRSLFAIFYNNRSNQDQLFLETAAKSANIITTASPAMTITAAKPLKTIPNDGRSSLVFKAVLVKMPSIRNGKLQIYNLTETNPTDYNLFIIYTKENYQLHVKFELFIRSLFKHSISNILLHLHIIIDESSGHSVEQILEMEIRRYRRTIIYSLYNMRLCAERIVGIVQAMQPYFSSTPKSYYSDSLFFISLGLHMIADIQMEQAILLDCDIVFRADVRLLFEEFKHFSVNHLFGLAPELTPVYRHILYKYRANYPKTDFGSPFYRTASTSALTTNRDDVDSDDNDDDNHDLMTSSIITHNTHHSHKMFKSQHGYPGLNSGVVLLQLQRIRTSLLYQKQLQENQIRKLANKYMFKGHLGDQDFFTLIGYEFPTLIYRLDCIWNRQLCTWWKDHGYSDVFDRYFTCKGHIKMYHGNCNARIPE